MVMMTKHGVAGSESIRRSGAATSPLATVDIVVPVYNEVRALPGCVRVLDEFLGREVPFPASITIVDNASTDGTFDLTEL